MKLGFATDSVGLVLSLDLLTDCPGPMERCDPQ